MIALSKPTESSFLCKINNCTSKYSYVKDLVNHINDKHIINEARIINNEKKEEVWIPRLIDYNSIVSECVSELRVSTSLTQLTLAEL